MAKEIEERARQILDLLEHEYPDVHYYLNFGNPLELLVAAILSARCRDEVVNATTKKLFAKYKRAEEYATVSLGELEQDIARVPFYRNKAKNIQEACRILVERYNGEVPRSIEELMKLPGIGRKTANVVLINAFDQVEGIVVDTHVSRLAQRLGLSESKDPEQVERDLMMIVPRSGWKRLPWLFKAHGRTICTAQRPKCAECVLNELCPRVGVGDGA